MDKPIGNQVRFDSFYYGDRFADTVSHQSAGSAEYENILYIWSRQGDGGTHPDDPAHVALPNFNPQYQRSYWYARGEYEKEAPLADDPQAQCLDTSAECSAGITKRTPLLGLPRARKSWIDYSVNEDTSYSKVRFPATTKKKRTIMSVVLTSDSVPQVVNGVRIGEGDGTVSLISLGGMCVEGWKRPRWNPARIKVITHEVR
jgi:hypothetical protein